MAVNWGTYDKCPSCAAWTTEPCFDKRRSLARMSLGTPSYMYKKRPCKGRPRTIAWHESWL